MTTVRETERKYELEEDTELPRWSDVPGLHHAADPEELLLEAVYFDTAELDLAAAGITLRRRRGGSDRGWHLKLPAGPDSRDELRVAFTPDEADHSDPRPPAELVALVRAFTRGRDLVAVAELSTTRRQWLLTDDTGRELVEVVDDRVTARPSDGPATTWREAEVELAEHGDAALLDLLEQHLGEAGVRRSRSRSKLARVLGGRVPVPARPARLHSRSTLGEVVLSYLHEQRAAIRDLDPSVRRELPDSVHQMRVATRRMRSALQAYGRAVDRDRTRELAAELKWLAAVLGGARDLEVLEERITAALAEVPEELVLGPVRAHVERYFAERRAAAHDELVAALDGERYLALLAAVDALVADPPLTVEARMPAREQLGRLVRRLHRRVADHVRVAEGLPLGGDRDTELHEARKAAKRLRYATEAAAPVLGKPARTLISRTKEVQELLGDHQDSVVALPVLRDLGEQAHLEGANGFTYGLLHEREHSHLPDDALGPAWERLDEAARAAAATRA